MCVVVCQQTGQKFAAESLAATFILQYLLMLVTLVFYVTVAIRVIGIDDGFNTSFNTTFNTTYVM